MDTSICTYIYICVYIINTCSICVGTYMYMVYVCAHVCMVKPGLNQTKFTVVVDCRVREMELGRRM